MKYLILSILMLMPFIGFAETNAPAATVPEEVTEEKVAPVAVLTVEQERDKLLKEIKTLEKKIAVIEKDNVQLKNSLMRVRQKSTTLLKLSIKANSATSKILDELESF